MSFTYSFSVVECNHNPYEDTLLIKVEYRSIDDSDFEAGIVEFEVPRIMVLNPTDLKRIVERFFYEDLRKVPDWTGYNWYTLSKSPFKEDISTEFLYKPLHV